LTELQVQLEQQELVLLGQLAFLVLTVPPEQLGATGATGATGAAGIDGATGATGVGATGATGPGGSGTKTYTVFTPDDNQPPASDFATLDTRNSILVLDFAEATDESAIFVGVIPEAASLGSGAKDSPALDGNYCNQWRLHLGCIVGAHDH
jgi:hypothetical protein